MATQLSLRNRSWRPQQLFGEQASRRRRIRRAIATVVFLTLLVAFLAMVARPMVHVNTRVAFLTADPNRLPGRFGAPYADETLAALEQLEPALYRDRNAPGRPQRLPPLTSDQSLRDIAAAITGPQTSSDALILFVAADGLVLGDQPYLVGAEFDPAQPQLGAIAVSALFEELKQRTAAVKLVVFDTGYHCYDPRAGLLMDDFIHQLERTVDRNSDDRLWVLASHASHERPHLSPAMRRTVFSFFVTEGLRGAADANLDQQITVGELHRFVDNQVEQWTRQATDGRESQSAPLFHANGDGAFTAATPTLLSVSRIELPKRVIDMQEALSVAATHRDALPPLRPAEKSAPDVLGQLPPLPNHSDHLEQRRNQWRQFLVAIEPPRDRDGSAPMDSGADQSAAEIETKGSGTNGNGGDDSGAEGSDAGTGQPLDPRTIDLYRERSAIVGELLLLRDMIRSDIHHHRQILARAPHLWREFDMRLEIAWTALEQQAVSTRDTRYEELRRLVPTIRALAARKSQVPAARRGLARRFAVAWNGFRQPPIEDNLASHLRHSGNADLQTFAQRFDDLLGAETQPDLDAFLKQVPADGASLDETRLLRELAVMEQVPWSHRQRALMALRLANQAVAFGQSSIPWISHLIEIGNVYRDDGIRDLLNGAALASQQAMENSYDKLTAACEAYLDATEVIQTVYIAHLMNDRCLYELNDLLAWAFASLDAPPNQSVDADRLQQLLTHARKLSELLDQADPETFSELKLELDLAIRQLHLVTTGVTDEAIEHLSNTRLAGDRVGIDALVSSSLIEASQKARLLENRLLMDQELADGFQPNRLASNAAAPVEDAATQRRWEIYWQLARVELELAQFASGATITETDPFNEAVSGRKDEKSRWMAAAALEFQLEQQLGDLPLVIDGRAANASIDATATLRSAHRAMLVLDPRDAARIVSQQSSQQLELAQLHQFMTWRRREAMLSQAFATPAVREKWKTEANQFGVAATNLFPGVTLPPDTRPRISVEVSAVSTDQLQRLEKPVKITISNAEPAPLFLWVTVDVDSELVELNRERLRVYSIRGDNPNSQRLQKDSPPTMRLAAGQSRDLTVPIRILSEIAGTLSARVCVIASRHDQVAGVIGASMLGRHVIPIQVDNTYISQRTWINAPTAPDVVFQIDGPENCVVPEGNGYRLLTFPNRETRFQFSLSSQSPLTKKARVRLLQSTAGPARLPRGSVTHAQLEELLRELGPMAPAHPPMSVTFEAPETKTPLPFVEVDAEADGVAPKPLARSVIAVVEPDGADQVILQQFQIEVQHPRRYSAATARYSSERQRIEIELQVKPNTTKPDGPIKVVAYLENGPLKAGVASRLSATLENDDVARLHIDLPPSPGAIATVRLDVDDYPRAFSFDVRCDADAEAKLVDPLGVKIVAPGKFQSFPAPLEVIRTRIQVDSPPGSLESPDNFVEVGVDRDMDRDFQGDRTIKLPGERQVTASIAAANSMGELAIATTADDFEVDVPASGLQNIRVNLLAQLNIGTVVAQDAAEEVWLDGLRPRVVVQDIDPGRILEVGQALTLTVDGVDDELGFVKQLQASFDRKGTGTFDTEMPPVEGEKLQGNRWNVVVPTDGLDPGRHNVLLRAVDHVGNVGEYSSLRVTIVPPLPEADKNKGRIIGTVRYRQAAAAGATVTLEAQDAAVKLEKTETVSDEQGVFVFDQVPLGKYTVIVRLLRRNTRLKDEQEVEVVAPPEKTDFLEVDLK